MQLSVVLRINFSRGFFVLMGSMMPFLVAMQTLKVEVIAFQSCSSVARTARNAPSSVLQKKWHQIHVIVDHSDLSGACSHAH